MMDYRSFFVSNLGKNKLFLNRGNLTFEDVSEHAHIEGISTWNTGVTMVDINWLDIYVCAVVGIHGFMGQNELFINQQDGTFKEQAAAYGLAIQSYSTNSLIMTKMGIWICISKPWNSQDQ